MNNWMMMVFSMETVRHSLITYKYIYIYMYVALRQQLIRLMGEKQQRDPSTGASHQSETQRGVAVRGGGPDAGDH